MPTKQEILDGIENFDADALAQFIKRGTVTLDELKSDPEAFPRKKQKEVEKALRAEEKRFAEAAFSGGVEECSQYIAIFPHGEDYQAIVARREELQLDAEERERNAEQHADWELAKQEDSIDAYRDFLSRYPRTPYREEAQELIDAVVDQEIRGSKFEQLLAFIRHNQKEEDSLKVVNRIVKDVEARAVDRETLLECLLREPNLIRSGTMRRLIIHGIYSYDNLLTHGANKEILAMLGEERDRSTFTRKEYPLKLKTPYTEVFFWGIPSSGKTCALGALLSTAEDRGMERIECQGYDYMNRLANIFSPGRIRVLPGSTPETAIYEMCFNLPDKNGRLHPLSFIDLAGELFRALYKDVADDMLPELEEPFEALNSILRSQRTVNRKMHFFVLEYGGHEKVFDGIRQDQYLDGAATWLSGKGIFDKDTDAIYILVTKCDLACPNGEDVNEVLREYIETHYIGFYKTMRQLCRKYDINGGDLEIIPFSVGDIYFQDYCRFDNESASAVLDTILDNSAKQDRRGAWGKILNFFRE